MTLLRHALIALLLILWPALVQAQQAEQPDPDSDLGFYGQLFDASATAAEQAAGPLRDNAGKAAVLNNIDDLLTDDPDQAMRGYENAMQEGTARQAAARRLAKAAPVLERIAKGFKIAEIYDNLSEREWREAAGNAAAFAADLAVKVPIGVLAGAAAVVACGVTGGVLCLFAAAAISAAALSSVADGVAKYGTEKAIDGAAWLYTRGRNATCRYRPDSRLCDYLPSVPTAADTVADGEAGNADRAGRVASRTSAAAASRGQSAATGAGRSGGNGIRTGSSYGSTRISARAGTVVTSAVGSGTAITDIGTSKGGSANLNVRAGTVVTKSTGRRTETVIGRGNGTVSTGMVYNQGGTLAIGDNGVSKRNGKLCLRFYLNLCIVRMYPRPPKKPCPPPPWLFDGVMCLLPADYEHQVVGKPF